MIDKYAKQEKTFSLAIITVSF